MDRTFGRELPQRRTARLGRSRPEVQNGRLPSSDSKTGDFEFREFLYNFVNLSPMFHAISTPIRSMTAHMLHHLRQPFFPSGARRRQRRPVSFPKALRLLPCAALLLLAATTRAQERRTTHDDDFRARFSFALTKRLGQRHAITLDEELRLKENWSQLDRIYTTLSYAYDVRPWLKTAVFYALIASDRGTGRSMEMRHRFYLELTASCKTGAWRFSLRERPQTTLRTAQVDPAVTARSAWVLRHRVQAEYTVSGTGFKPYAFVELTQTLNAPTVGNYLEKVRSSLGVKYAFDKRSSLECYYRFDYKITDKPIFDDFQRVDYISSERGCHHIVGLEYGYKF